MKTITKIEMFKVQSLIAVIIILQCSVFMPVISSAQSNRIWATYYGGPGLERAYTNIATDAFGNVYLVGQTNSTSSIAANGFQDSLGGATDAYLVKFDAAGNRLWATYYGGSGDEAGTSVATDAAGNVYLAGTTSSYSGIAYYGYQNNLGGGTDAFLVKFDGSGNRLWATYYGGSGDEGASSVATDQMGNVYLGASTPGGGGADVFLAKFDGSGKKLWANIYGGSGDESGRLTVATDLWENVYLAGETTSSFGIASPNGFQTALGGGTDAFLVKFDSTGNRIWATYYGGTGDEKGSVFQSGSSVATDDSGNVYLAGNTNSFTHISYHGFQNVYGNNIDAFLVKFDSSGKRMWATYYGGSDDDEIGSVATDAAGNVYLGGFTSSASNIADNGFQSIVHPVCGFVVTFNNGGNRVCASYYGQDYDQNTSEIAVGGHFSANVTYTNSACSGSSSGGTATATPSGGSGPYTYLWSTVPVQTTQTVTGLAAGNYTVTISENAAGNVYLSGITKATTNIAYQGFQNSYGGGSCDAFLVKFSTCANTSTSVIKSIAITQGAAKAGTVTALRDTICAGSQCNLTITGSSGNLQWQSSGSPQGTYTSISGSSNTTFNEQLNQTSYFRVIATNGICKDTTYPPYRIFVPPALTAFYTDTSTTGATFTFNSDSSKGNIISYSWNFGDGTTSTDSNPAHTYIKTDTTYNVCLTIYDGSNCSYTFCRNVFAGNINGIPFLAGTGNWAIYPNPFSNYFFIGNNPADKKIESVEIYDLLGRTVAGKSVMDGENNPVKMDASGLPAGMYYLKILSNGKYYMQPVLKM